MLTRPNSGKDFDSLNERQDSDLYRKFKLVFDSILDISNQRYEKATYVHVDEYLEKKIKEDLSAETDKTIALVGRTGSGKTHLIRTVLSDYYSLDDLEINNPQIIKNSDNKIDILFYSTHENYNNELLRTPDDLVHVRIKTLSKYLVKWYAKNVGDIDKTRRLQEILTDGAIVQEYINSVKMEVLEYPDGKGKENALITMKFKKIVEELKDYIHQIVFVYDDLESLEIKPQIELMASFLALQECLYNKKPDTVHYKFSFIMRKSTFNAISDTPRYNTHRTYNPYVLNSCPKMNLLFSNRFNQKYNNTNVVGNRDTWDAAQKVLLKLASKLEDVNDMLLYNYCNGNVCRALLKFTSILSNRKWTQRNVNIKSEFKIDEYEYYINSANIFRVIFKDESFVYIPHRDAKSLFPSGGDLVKDVACLYILAYLIKDSRGTNSTGHTEKSIYTFIESIFDKVSPEGQLIVESIPEIIGYYLDSEYISYFEVINEQVEKISKNEKRYSATLRGDLIFKQFFQSSILWEIFRDDFSLPDDDFKTECSYELNSIEVDEEFYKYILYFQEFEYAALSKLFNNKLLRMRYKTNIGNELLSTSMLRGLQKSLSRYNLDEQNKDRINELRRMVQMEIEKADAKF